MSRLLFVDTPHHALQDDDETPDPVLVAKDLRLETGQGVVFDGVTTEVPRGAVVAVTGKAGVGKSALLLALTGRMRGVTGELSVDGFDALRHPGRVRKITAVARIDDLVEPEDSLSLEDCITERTLADAAPARSRMANYLHTSNLLGLDVPLTTLYGDLSPADQVKAAISLATIRPAPLIVLDDIDRETTTLEQGDLWEGLLRLADEGVSIIASTSERTAIPLSVLSIEMDTPHAR